MYQRQVDGYMLNTAKSVLADVSSVSPSSEQRTLVQIIDTPGFKPFTKLLRVTRINVNYILFLVCFSGREGLHSAHPSCLGSPGSPLFSP